MGAMNGVVKRALAQTLLLTLALIAGPVSGMTYSFEEVNAAADDGDWRSKTVDPDGWEDGPELEGSPMDIPQYGDPVIQIEVSYKPGHLDIRRDGVIEIELFEEWAPITVANMVKHVENDLYDGIFFHRVIDDFVTQSGDPECKAVGVYVPGLPPQCGEGGTGETIPLEHDENLSHVDGAIGMARSLDPDSADSQWYIAETEAHNLDPENRDDEGYATFGVVRSGMSHIRSIALTPTTDDPSGLPSIQNPASTAGRPVYEAKIVSISLIGVVWNESAEPSTNDMESSGLSKLVQSSLLPVTVIILLLLIGLGARIDDIQFLYSVIDDVEASEEANGLMVAELVETK
ncbi:MAG: peptidylprolyl isomerase [Euryarchaeota archaeon]|jgi:cyclophilin family peptidyl-prolyl cis-trans isomerase|nr:peptidylprolyl isomerase [Euryarchaeota archaeon]MBT3971553.1 peptidylprolyl isomerase [Euryarchaeota archaeon]